MGRKRATSIYAKSMEEYMADLKEESQEKFSKKSPEESREKSQEESPEDIGTAVLSTNDKILLENKIIKQTFEESDKLVRKLTEEIKTNSRTKTVEADEQELLQQLERINQAYKSPSDDTRIDSGLLCSYLTESMKSKSSEKIKLLIYPSIKIKKLHRSMSNNVIHDINMKEVFDEIMKKPEEENGSKCEGEAENDLYYDYDSLGGKIRSARFSQTSSSSSMSKEIFIQNVECEEEVMKVMLIGSTFIGKTKLINNFLECRKNKYIPSSGLEIKKKIVKLLNKTVRLEFFDTDANFHNEYASKIYYRICDVFIYVVDCSKAESFLYIKNVHEKIFDNSSSKSFILIAINWDESTNSNNNIICNTQVKEMIQRYTSEFNITLLTLSNVDNFIFKNAIVNNLFASMFIKKMNINVKRGYIRNNRKNYKSKTIANSCSTWVMNNNSYLFEADPLFSAKDNYRIENYNAFNEEVPRRVLRMRRRGSF